MFRKNYRSIIRCKMEEVKSPQKIKWYFLFLLVIFVIGGLFIGQFISLMAIVVIYGFDLEQVIDALSQTSQDNQGRWIMMVNLGIVSLFTFFIAPLAYLKFVENKTLPELNARPKLLMSGLFLILLITITIMPFNALLIEWNMKMQFPSFLSGFEEWAFQKEAELKVVTEFLTDFQSFPQFLIGLIVVAIIPALGEEVLFRGVIQRITINYVSPHLAILITALLFSAIHIQFYGFFPRMLLGILFGYFYYWSGNIWTAILAHFINNGFTLLMVYLYKQQTLEYNIEETASVPLSVALISLVLSLALLGLFKYLHQRKQLMVASSNEIE